MLRQKEIKGLYYVMKTNAQISCAINSPLICAFVFEHAKNRFSHDVANKSDIMFYIPIKFSVCYHFLYINIVPTLQAI